MQIIRREFSETALSQGKMPSILHRIYATRGISDQSQLDKRLQALLPFDALTDVEKACIRLEKALREQQRILVIGDFDADGATSTAVAILALRAMGAKQAEFLVCNRFEFGYGLTPGIIGVAQKWNPDLIITVDNGISSIEGVDTANAVGIDVLITDHHLPGEFLPKACAIVNPNQTGDNFKSKSIAGVGVIFYVMLALRRSLVKSAWFSEIQIPEPNMAQFLDLVALGTVADVVALDQNNRILVSQGLARIRQGFCSPGIRALIEIAGKQCEHLKESDLGFSLAPRLNAAGRLDDMTLGISCLLADNLDTARQFAERLNELNQERKVIETEMKEQALSAVQQLAKKMENLDQLPIALCLMDESWHQGVIGILAGRLKEKFHRPVVIFALISEQELKGSVRSVAGINIRDVLADIDKNKPGLISKFGGHAMAAGLSLPPEHFREFQEAFVTEVGKNLDVSKCQGLLLTDGSLNPSEMNLEIADLLQNAGPWGQQFPEPCFDDIFEILEQRIVGQNHLKLVVVHEQGGEPIDAIAFNIDNNLWPNHRVAKVHLVYKLNINVYQKRSRVQLLIESISPIKV
jgi:single-stranded-DNA-specific exonuclease